MRIIETKTSNINHGAWGIYARSPLIMLVQQLRQRLNLGHGTDDRPTVTSPPPANQYPLDRGKGLRSIVSKARADPAARLLCKVLRAKTFWEVFALRLNCALFQKYGVLCLSGNVFWSQILRKNTSSVYSRFFVFKVYRVRGQDCELKEQKFYLCFVGDLPTKFNDLLRR